jgi:hypothetical protein
MNATLSNCSINSDKVEYYTPTWVWDCLASYIPKDKVIWEAFRCDDELSTKSAEYLRTLGFQVVNPLCDFFENDYGDIVVSNPPYNKKKEVIKRLIELDKPFILILPNIILNTLYFIELAKNNKDIAVGILPRRVDFIKREGGKSACTFHTLVISYKIFKERLIFL